MRKKQEVKQWKKREPEAMYDTRHRREGPLNSALLHGLSPTQDSAVFSVKFIIVSVIWKPMANPVASPKPHLLLPSTLIKGWRGTTPGGQQMAVGWRQPAAQVQLISVDVNSHCPIQGPLR